MARTFPRIRQRLTFANVVALLALFFALGSSSFAEPVRSGALKLISGEQIRSGSVTSRHIRPAAVTNRHVRNGSLTGADVRDNTLGARDLLAGVAANDVLGTARFRRRSARASQVTDIQFCNSTGQVLLFGGDYAPAGTLPARGQVLPIAEHAALAAVYGNRFGGDGRKTFALPDLRGAEPKGIDGTAVGYLVCLNGPRFEPPPPR
jgi:hypothetical protein